MPFKFTNQPLKQGLYEPEGIYLNLPFAGEGLVLQPFGVQQPQSNALTYNGVPLKGHIGVAFGVMPSVSILAVDDGRVVEISYDPAGLGRYIKLAHAWGESLCALIGEASVDSGHHVVRGEPLGRASSESLEALLWGVLLFAVHVQPFNRFDGWGGFSNPLVYLSVDDVRFRKSRIEKPFHCPSISFVKKRDGYVVLEEFGSYTNLPKYREINKIVLVGPWDIWDKTEYQSEGTT